MPDTLWFDIELKLLHEVGHLYTILGHEEWVRLVTAVAKIAVEEKPKEE